VEGLLRPLLASEGLRLYGACGGGSGFFWACEWNLIFGLLRCDVYSDLQ
jgi:hypothetical protein